MACSLIAAPALAQPSLAPVNPQPQFAQPPPEAAPSVVKKSRFAVGAHFFGGPLTDESSASMSELAGGGVFARLRLSRRFRVEVAMERMRATMSGDRVREFSGMQGSLLMKMFGFGGFSAFARAGYGQARERYESREGLLEFDDAVGHVGLSLEYRPGARNFAVIAEMRGVSIARSVDGGARRDGGQQAGLGLLYYFY